MQLVVQIMVDSVVNSEVDLIVDTNAIRWDSLPDEAESVLRASVRQVVFRRELSESVRVLGEVSLPIISAEVRELVYALPIACDSCLKLLSCLYGNFVLGLGGLVNAMYLAESSEVFVRVASTILKIAAEADVACDRFRDAFAKLDSKIAELAANTNCDGVVSAIAETKKNIAEVQIRIEVLELQKIRAIAELEAVRVSEKHHQDLQAVRTKLIGKHLANVEDLGKRLAHQENNAQRLWVSNGDKWAAINHDVQQALEQGKQEVMERRERLEAEMYDATRSLEEKKKSLAKLVEDADKEAVELRSKLKEFASIVSEQESTYRSIALQAQFTNREDAMRLSNTFARIRQSFSGVKEMVMVISTSCAATVDSNSNNGKIPVSQMPCFIMGMIPYGLAGSYVATKSLASYSSVAVLQARKACANVSREVVGRLAISATISQEKAQEIMVISSKVSNMSKLATFSDDDL